MKINYHTQSGFCGVGKEKGRPCKGHLLKSVFKGEINEEGAAITSTNVKWEHKQGRKSCCFYTYIGGHIYRYSPYFLPSLLLRCWLLKDFCMRAGIQRLTGTLHRKLKSFLLNTSC